MNRNRNSSDNPDRRQFIKSAAIGAVASIALPRILTAGNGNCTATTADIEGPFYSAGAPFRTTLASASEPGTRLFISGRVTSSIDCDSPLVGATVDVWAADDNGCYSVFNQCSTAPGVDNYNLRGRMLTGADGRYSFETVKPAPYQGRPSHIHFRITDPNGKAIVTQLYFTGDPLIANDPWASQPNAVDRIIPLEQRSDGLHGTFNILLATAAQSGAYEPTDSEDAEFSTPNPNPMTSWTEVRVRLRRPARVDIVVYDMRGARVRTLRAARMTAGDHQIRWNRLDDDGRKLPAGSYLLWMQAGELMRTMTVALL